MIVNKYNTGGGGGGGYTLPTATANRLGGVKIGSGITVENDGTISVTGETYQLPAATDQVLGGVKIGAGISVDSGGTISVSGGTGGDYMVVSELPQSAENGQLFFVPAHTALEPATAYTFDCSQFEGGSQFATIADDGIYFEPNGGGSGDFYWTWDGDGEWHDKYWGRYKADGSNGVFYAEVLNDSFVTINEQEQPITITTGTTAITVDYPDETYRYEAAKTGFTKQVMIVDFNMQGLFSFLQQYSADYIKDNMVFYRSDSREPVYFDYYDNGDYFFNEGVSYSEPIGPPELVTSRNYYCNAGGTEPFNDSRKALPMRVFVNLTDSGVSSDSSMWVRTAYSATDFGGNPICVKVLDGDDNIVGWTQNCWFRQAYDGDNSDWVQISDGEPNVRIFGCEWYMYGDKITAEWALDGEGSVVGGAPLNWTVTSNVHSSADSTIPNNS